MAVDRTASVKPAEDIANPLDGKTWADVEGAHGAWDDVEAHVEQSIAKEEG